MIFALLGPNGAGKSTTFGMLSSITSPTKGNIILCGEKIGPNSHDIFMKLGLCMQVNTLWEDLTV